MINKNQNRQTVDEMINHITKENNLVHFLSKNEIAEIDQIDDVQHYKKDDNRRGIIVDVKEKNADTRTKILIDLKQGQPTINQVYDSLYDIGKDCSIKIIMYRGGHNENDSMIPTADEYVVNSSIVQLQESNVGILLCSICKEKIKIEDHFIYQYWKQVDRNQENELPTKEQFMAQTFWSVYFDSFSEGFYEPWNAYDGGFRDITDWGHLIYIDGIMKGEIKLYWDEDGVRYEIKQVSESDEYLKKVLDIDMPALKERYGDSAVNFENVVGRLPRLYIQYSDTPFSWLYTATPGQITEFARKMRTDAWDLRWQMETTVEKLFELEPAAV